MNKIPTLESITPEWLTERLRENGYPSAVVGSFSAEKFGTGQVGKCVRFSMDIQAGGPNVPRTLVGKFPSDNPVSRHAGVSMLVYEKEVKFYKHIASSLSISAPKCYYANIIDQGPEFLVLMEDMHPALQGDQIKGCNANVARAAILELVGLQAPTWCDRSMKGLLADPEDGPFSDMKSLYNQMLPGFLQRFSDQLEQDEIDIIKDAGAANVCPMYVPYAEDLFCLEHMDYRLDNLLIDEGITPPKVTVVDWQSVKVGKPLNDVAFFMGSGLDSELRREVEEGIIRDYHSALQESGVANFSWESCWKEYRKGVFAGFALTIVSAMVVEQTERGDEMFLTMARRHSRHAIDLDAWEFLN